MQSQCLTLSLKGIIGFCYFSYVKYVNRSFLDLSGYTRDEVIGKPAMDILKTFDSKTVSAINSLNMGVCDICS